MRTSYSAIETYIQCPQKYKFQNIDRLKAPKSREAVFGAAVHGALKFMFQNTPLFPTLDEVINRFREQMSSASSPEAAKNAVFLSEKEQKAYTEEGIKMLKSFYEKNPPWNFSVLDLESRFEVAILDEKENETHILAGIIDRIDKLPDGTYEIIDYKTAKRMPSQESVEKNIQLSVYSLGIRERWPHLKTENLKLSLYFLKHGEKLSVSASEKKIAATKEFFLQKISEIQRKMRFAEEFEPLPGPLCGWCGYKPICPAWKHLYRNNSGANFKDRNEVDEAAKEFIELKIRRRQDGARLEELQQKIKKYMEEEKITRIFAEKGIIAGKKMRRFSYDWEKVKSVLSPFGKWEDVLRIDEAKLRKVAAEIPEAARRDVEKARSLCKEYGALVVSPPSRDFPHGQRENID